MEVVYTFILAVFVSTFIAIVTPKSILELVNDLDEDLTVRIELKARIKNEYSGTDNNLAVNSIIDIDDLRSIFNVIVNSPHYIDKQESIEDIINNIHPSRRELDGKISPPKDAIVQKLVQDSQKLKKLVSRTERIFRSYIENEEKTDCLKNICGLVRDLLKLFDGTSGLQSEQVHWDQRRIIGPQYSRRNNLLEEWLLIIQKCLILVQEHPGLEKEIFQRLDKFNDYYASRTYDKRNFRSGESLEEKNRGIGELRERMKRLEREIFSYKLQTTGQEPDNYFQYEIDDHSPKTMSKKEFEEQLKTLNQYYRTQLSSNCSSIPLKKVSVSKNNRSKNTKKKKIGILVKNHQNGTQISKLNRFNDEGPRDSEQNETVKFAPVLKTTTSSSSPDEKSSKQQIKEVKQEELHGQSGSAVRMMESNKAAEITRGKVSLGKLTLVKKFSFGKEKMEDFDSLQRQNKLKYFNETDHQSSASAINGSESIGVKNEKRVANFANPEENLPRKTDEKKNEKSVENKAMGAEFSVDLTVPKNDVQETGYFMKDFVQAVPTVLPPSQTLQSA